MYKIDSPLCQSCKGHKQGSRASSTSKNTDFEGEEGDCLAIYKENVV